MSESTASKQTNGLGIAGLVIGLVALVFSVIPLVNVIVPFLAVIGLVLGVVGLLRKSRKKGIAIAGAVTSLAAIFSSVAFASIYAESFNDAISTDVEVIENAQSDSVDQGEAQASEGTRDNPYPMGSAIKFGNDWEITVGPSTLNANELVASENQFNDSAPEGFQFAILTMEFTYVGDSTGTPWTSVSVDYVSPSGTTHSGSDTFVSYPGGLFSMNELFPGASGTGNVVIAIPEDGAADGVWRIQPLFIGDGVFFSAN
jgi:hypothetical protein